MREMSSGLKGKKIARLQRQMVWCVWRVIPAALLRKIPSAFLRGDDEVRTRALAMANLATCGKRIRIDGGGEGVRQKLCGKEL